MKSNQYVSIQKSVAVGYMMQDACLRPVGILGSKKPCEGFSMEKEKQSEKEQLLNITFAKFYVLITGYQHTDYSKK